MVFVVKCLVTATDGRFIFDAMVGEVEFITLSPWDSVSPDDSSLRYNSNTSDMWCQSESVNIRELPSVTEKAGDKCMPVLREDLKIKKKYIFKLTL